MGGLVRRGARGHWHGEKNLLRWWLGAESIHARGHLRFTRCDSVAALLGTMRRWHLARRPWHSLGMRGLPAWPRAVHPVGRGVAACDSLLCAPECAPSQHAACAACAGSTAQQQPRQAQQRRRQQHEVNGPCIAPPVWGRASTSACGAPAPVPHCKTAQSRHPSI